jgi:hypothetical protein
VIRDLIFKTQPEESAIRQVQVGLFTQPPLGANALAIALDQHANHQFWINRLTPDWTVEIGEVKAQVTQIETLINAAQKMIGRDVTFKVERVKQSFLLTR